MCSLIRSQPPAWLSKWKQSRGHVFCCVASRGDAKSIHASSLQNQRACYKSIHASSLQNQRACYKSIHASSLQNQRAGYKSIHTSSLQNQRALTSQTGMCHVLTSQTAMCQVLTSTFKTTCGCTVLDTLEWRDFFIVRISTFRS